MSSDFLALAARRCSIRGFLSDPVPEELLEQVLEAGRLAPTAANRQPVHTVVVRDPDRRAALAEAYPKAWFAEAPVQLAVCVESEAAWVRKDDDKGHADVDGSIVMDHMILCAASLGLGTCWICAFDPTRVRRALGLPDGIEPLALTPLGFPAKEGREKSRKPLSETVHWERW